MTEEGITITPTQEYAQLRVTDVHPYPHALDVMRRWLERKASRKGWHINIPSVEVGFRRDFSLRQTFLDAYADSFPDTMPDWLRTMAVKRGGFVIEG